MSATFSAAHGANSLELQQKHNWSNQSMPLEYLGISEPHQDKMAGYVQGIPVTTASVSVSRSLSNLSLSEPSTSTEPMEFIEASDEHPSNKKMKTGENMDTNENETSIAGNVYRFINCTGNINITINK